MSKKESRDQDAARRRAQTASGTEAIMRETDVKKYATRLHSRGWTLIAPPHILKEFPEAARFATSAGDD
jgi:hypothetical protein